MCVCTKAAVRGHRGERAWTEGLAEARAGLTGRVAALPSECLRLRRHRRLASLVPIRVQSAPPRLLMLTPRHLGLAGGHARL